MNYLKRLWHKFFGPNLGKTLGKAEKIVAKLDQVVAYQNQEHDNTQAAIVSLQTHALNCRRDAERATQVSTNFRQLLGM